MLYIEEKGFARQLDVLRALAVHRRLQVCAWLYPESQQNTLAGFKVVPHQGLQPVTTYEDGTLPSRTKLVPATEGAIEAMRVYESEVKAHCDSIALYIGSSAEWYAATIGHEGMCLVRCENSFYPLQDAGFSVSKEPPEWW